MFTGTGWSDGVTIKVKNNGAILGYAGVGGGGGAGGAVTVGVVGVPNFLAFCVLLLKLIMIRPQSL